MAELAKDDPEDGASKHRIARVAFLAALETVKADLLAGWSARAIYERHANRFAGKVSYPQFARYVRKLREEGIEPPVAPSQGRATQPQRRAEPAKAPGSAPPGGEAPPLPLRRRPAEFNPQRTPDDHRRLTGEED